MNPNVDAVVAMSGGQDSTTCLAWAIDRWGPGRVHAVAFDYGQRHAVELDSAEAICFKLGVPFLVLGIDAFAQLGAAALTSPTIDVATDATDSGNEHAEREGLPSTFVPGRNLIFLGLVGAYAAQHGITNVVTGVCAADEAGYPDCRPEFIVSMQHALNMAMGLPYSREGGITIHAPLIFLDKAKTWKLAADLGILETIVRDTHTCYNGDRTQLHDWGHGCGECGACVERAAGYASWQKDNMGAAPVPG